MELKGAITFDEICGKPFKNRLVEDTEKVVLTHYLHNRKNIFSEFYKREALNYTNRLFLQQ